MLLIVGLGNPDKKYFSNRHNLGFMVIDALHDTICRKQTVPGFDWQQKHKANISKYRNVMLLAKPQTFMNLSGESVVKITHFYKVPTENILLVYDDIDSSFGKVSYRQKGSAGGHNGVKSICEQLSTQDIQRVKIGVGRPPAKMDPAAYVLQDFSKEEKEHLNEIIGRAVERVISWIDTSSGDILDMFAKDSKN
ncbi:MAG: aminoacyl-tRNA hydrolase [Candidatus Margulisiibacteriota bacterium]